MRGARTLVFIASLVAGIAAASWSAHEPAAAQPDPGNIGCEWRRLADGDARAEHTLASLPDRGLIAVGGVDYAGGSASPRGDTPRLLDLSASEDGVWSDYTGAGAGPGPVADHVATGRVLPDGGYHMVVHGGRMLASPLVVGASETPAQVLRSEVNTLIVTGPMAIWCRRIAPAGAPLLGQHAAIWNPADDSLIVFGGRTSAAANAASRAVWRLPLADAEPVWQRYRGTVSASERYGHSAVYDSAGKRMVVFGGTSDGRTGLNDVHVFDLAGGWDAAAWRALATEGPGPRGRYGHSAVYEPERNWLIVRGGVDPAPSPLGRVTGRLANLTLDEPAQEPTLLGDTWALDLNTTPAQWMELQAIGGPPPASSSGGHYIRVGPHFGAASQAQGVSAAGMAVFQGGYVLEGGQRRSLSETWGLACGPEVAPTPTPAGPVVTPTPVGAQPDLVIASGELRWRGWMGGCVSVLPELETVACVRNDGQAEAGPFSVASNGAPMWRAEGLGAGQTLCLDPQVGDPDVLLVDAGGEVRESDEMNNRYDLPRPTPPSMCRPLVPAYLPSLIRGEAPADE